MVLREWTTSWDKMVLSIIFLPSTYFVCSSEMRFERRGFKRRAMTLVMSLYMALHSAIGWQFQGLVSFSSFRVRDIKVTLRANNTSWEVLESSMSFHTSYLTKDQKWWKKFVVKPSGLGDFPSAISFMAWSTSSWEISLNRISFFSWVTRLGICWVIFLIASPMSTTRFVMSSF